MKTTKTTLYGALLSMSLITVSISFVSAQSISYGLNPDISNTNPTGNSFFVSSQETLPSDLGFSPDGNLMFVSGADTDALNIYTLSTPFDITTSLYSSSFSVFRTNNNPAGFTFSDDGFQLFVIQSYDELVEEYTLTTAFDLSTATNTGNTYSVTTQESFPHSLTFNRTGTKMYVGGDYIQEYNLSTAYDVTTATHNYTFTAPSSNVWDIQFNDAGTRLYFIAGLFGKVHQYELSTPYDLATAIASEEYRVQNDITNARAFALSEDGTKLMVLGEYNNDILEFDLEKNAFVEKVGSIEGELLLTLAGDTFVSAGNALNGTHYSIPNLPGGLTSNLTVGADGQSALLQLSGIPNETTDVSDLQFTFTDAAFTNSLATNVTNATGPASSGQGIDFQARRINYDNGRGLDERMIFSGNSTVRHGFPRELFLTDDGTKLFFVAHPAGVYEHTLSTPFNISTATFSQSFLNDTDGEYPEGLTFNNDGSKMFVSVTGAAKHGVNEYALSTAFDISTASHTVFYEVTDFLPNGVSFNDDGSRMFIAGGDVNKIHSYTLLTPFDLSTAEVSLDIYSVTEGFYSPNSVRFNDSGSRMYVVVFGLVYEYQLSSPYVVGDATFLQSFEIQSDAEAQASGSTTGIFLAEKQDKFYSVNFNGAVEEYDLKQPFYESNAIIGEIEGAMEISLSFDVFSNADGTLTSPDHFTIHNLPLGLTPSISVSSNAKSGTLNIIGRVDSHSAADGVDEFEFSFTSSAFENVDVAEFSNSTNHKSGLGLDLSDDLAELAYSMDVDFSETEIINTHLISDDSQMRSLAFSNDGLQLFIAGSESDKVYYYDLSIAFDVSTATLSGSFLTQHSNPMDLTFDDKGLKLLVLSYSSGIEEYELTKPFDLSTSTFVKTTSLPQQSAAFAMSFDSDGTSITLAENNGSKLYQYDLSVAYDLAGASAPYSFDPSEETTSYHFNFNKDGDVMYLSGFVLEDTLARYTLSTAFDLSTISFDSYIPTPFTSAREIALTDLGNKAFVITNDLSEVLEIDLGEPFKEADSNDGEVAGQLFISIKLDQFANGGSSLSSPEHYTIDGLPNGFSSGIDISSDGLTATLKLSGKADQHSDQEDVEELTFTFTGDAFLNSEASEVTNAVASVVTLGVDFFNERIPPSVVSFEPSDDGSGFAIDGDLIITFDENISIGNGEVTIKNKSDDSLVESIDITSSSIMLSGSTLTVSLTNNLSDTEDYYVLIDESSIKDVNGNSYEGISDSETWNFQSEDLTVPTIVGKGLAVDLDSNGAVEVDPKTMDDGSTDNLSEVDNLTFSLSQSTFDCSHIGANTVTLTVTDENGNSSSATFTIAVSDNISPIPDSAELGAFSSECSVDSLTPPTASDNCSESITGTTDEVLPITESKEITWTFVDSNGNSSTQTQQINVVDLTGPVPTTTTLETLTADCSIETLNAPGASDSCDGGIVSGTTTTTLPITGSTTISWIYSDSRGNTTTQIQEVIIEDKTPPTIGTIADFIETCAGRVNSLLAPSAIDNCDGNIPGITDQVFPITSTTLVTWTFTDLSGNVSTQTQNIIVEDGLINDVTQSNDQNCALGSTSFMVSTSNGNFTFLWEVDMGNGFVPITDGGIYSGAGTNTLNIDGLDSNMDGFEYRCVVADGNCDASSESIRLTVLPVFIKPEIVVTEHVDNPPTLSIQNLPSEFTSSSGVVHWYLDGVFLVESLELQATESGSYQALLSDNGVGLSCDSEFSEPIELSIITGLENYRQLSIYPNPVTTTINIQRVGGLPLLVSLVSLDGRIVFETRKESSIKSLQIPVENLKAGIYILNLEEDDYKYSRKIIIN